MTIKTMAKTGFVVDIPGQGPPSDTKKVIAFWADLDALEMFEGNQDLPYRSKKQAAHMCGHDGHITGLLGGVTLFKNNFKQIASNHIMRLIF